MCTRCAGQCSYHRRDADHRFRTATRTARHFSANRQQYTTPRFGFFLAAKCLNPSAPSKTAAVDGLKCFRLGLLTNHGRTSHRRYNWANSRHQCIIRSKNPSAILTASCNLPYLACLLNDISMSHCLSSVLCMWDSSRNSCTPSSVMLLYPLSSSLLSLFSCRYSTGHIGNLTFRHHHTAPIHPSFVDR